MSNLQFYLILMKIRFLVWTGWVESIAVRTNVVIPNSSYGT